MGIVAISLGGSRYKSARREPTLVGCLGPQSKNVLAVAIKYTNGT